MDQVKRYDSLLFLNEHGTTYCIILAYKLSPLEIEGIEKKKSSKGKKDRAKSMHKVLYLRMLIIKITLKAATRGTL